MNICYDQFVSKQLPVVGDASIKGDSIEHQLARQHLQMYTSMKGEGEALEIGMNEVGQS